MRKKLSPQEVKSSAKEAIIVGQLVFPELGKKQAASLFLQYLLGRKQAAILLGISSISQRSNAHRAKSTLRTKHQVNDPQMLIIKRLARLKLAQCSYFNYQKWK
ncbi:hypothetical protein [Vibrio maritimus]|uniref:hypothetical protein n=1 Tax=Vibrio maritimus TaxID=990268 RepID=UPI001F216F16|nr:hypothetical protein [Vibrio maritimus]